MGDGRIKSALNIVCGVAKAYKNSEKAKKYANRDLTSIPAMRIAQPEKAKEYGNQDLTAIPALSIALPENSAGKEALSSGDTSRAMDGAPIQPLAHLERLKLKLKLLGEENETEESDEDELDHETEESSACPLSWGVMGGGLIFAASVATMVGLVILQRERQGNHLEPRSKS